MDRHFTQTKRKIRPLLQWLYVTTCIHKHADLQSARFSTGINCVYPAREPGLMPNEATVSDHPKNERLMDGPSIANNVSTRKWKASTWRWMQAQLQLMRAQVLLQSQLIRASSTCPQSDGTQCVYDFLPGSLRAVRIHQLRPDLSIRRRLLVYIRCGTRG
jgi:hypothetical protein